MTVCIAALAENSKAIVAVSDKSSTLGPMREDTDVQKMLPLGSSWLGLTAGHGGRCDAIIRELSGMIRSDPGVAKDVGSLTTQLELIEGVLPSVEIVKRLP